MSKRILTDEQEIFFVNHQRGLLRQEAADLMNEKYGLGLTSLQVKELRRRLKPYVGDVGSFSGRIKPNSGQFKKGERSYNHVPVGTERVKNDGYVWRKIAEPNKWQQKHILLWEKAHGPRQEGEKIIFLNGDRSDIRLENLACVTCAVNAMLTTRKLRSTNPELTKTGINVARLYEACQNKSKAIKRRRKNGCA